MSVQHKKIPTGLIVLCVLTLVGNVLLVLANLLKIGLLETGAKDGGVGDQAHFYLLLLLVLNILTCFGSMAGAILMLNKKLLGYTIYAISMGIHTLLVICAIVLWAMTIYLIGISLLLMIYFLIPLTFFILFTTQRKHLIT